MKMIAIGAAAMLASATPAMAQDVDHDMLCLVSMASAAEAVGGGPTDRVAYDRAGGYYLQIVARRYPTPALFAPPLKAATSAAEAGDRNKTIGECAHAVDPALTLILNSLDLLGHK